MTTLRPPVEPVAGPGPALPDGAAHVGPRVRALRAERGMSLSELARRAGVGKATLSGLESGSRNPTLDTLHSVAAALGVALTSLVASTTPERAGRRIHGAAVRMELLRTFDDDTATYELYRMVVPAGAEQTSPAHHTGVSEHATVFAGVLRAGPLGETRRAGAGEYVEWVADRPHSYTAEGPDDVHASLLIRYPRP